MNGEACFVADLAERVDFTERFAGQAAGRSAVGPVALMLPAETVRDERP
jgi:hypothetical protein